MTDRELLKLAAKAADIFLFEDAEEKDGFCLVDSGLPWNPLADDGDEARLEAACSLNVIWVPEGVTVRGTLPDGTHFGRLESFANHRDRHSARRRAGVRAAAAIGEKMP